MVGNIEGSYVSERRKLAYLRGFCVRGRGYLLKSCKRRREFLSFLNEVVAAYPDQEIHVILDNFSTHKPKRDGWLTRHKNVHFHYTPTHASWLNQIEIWFSILSRKTLKGASFTSPREVREAIDHFVESHNAAAAPFEWRKKEVYPKELKKRYADLCK